MGRVFLAKTNHDYVVICKSEDADNPGSTWEIIYENKNRTILFLIPGSQELSEDELKIIENTTGVWNLRIDVCKANFLGRRIIFQYNEKQKKTSTVNKFIEINVQA